MAWHADLASRRLARRLLRGDRGWIAIEENVGDHLRAALLDHVDRERAAIALRRCHRQIEDEALAAELIARPRDRLAPTDRLERGEERQHLVAQAAAHY